MMTTAMIEATESVTLTCDRAALLAAMQLAAGIAPAKSPSVVLQGVKLTVGEAGAELAATDGELGILVTLAGVTSAVPAACVLPAQQFLKILATSDHAEITLEIGATSCVVRDAGASFELPTPDPATFPDLPTPDSDAGYVVSGADLATAIKRTAFAVEAKGSKYAIGGTLAEAAGGSLRLTGTDGNRVARMAVPAPAEGPADPGERPVLSLKSLRALERFLGDAPVRLTFSKFAAWARVGDATMWTRLVEGRFPDWSVMLDDAPDHRLAVRSGELLAAVERAAITAGDDSRGVRLRFGGSVVRLGSRAAHAGSSDVSLAVASDVPAAEPIVDHRYVLDVLKAIGPDAEVSVGLFNHGKRVLFRLDDGFACAVATQEG